MDGHHPGVAGLGVQHRVAARLGHRELEVGERRLIDLHPPRDSGQGEAREDEVLRPRGDLEPDDVDAHRTFSCIVSSSRPRIT